MSSRCYCHRSSVSVRVIILFSISRYLTDYAWIKIKTNNFNNSR